ncbi:MAG: DUF3131 domain-containing protein [Candidatus Omnitrophica bacterium]|nr:DUF3131 domain-containing protein [Candidatus Omnitrophota bacterium]
MGYLFLFFFLLFSGCATVSKPQKVTSSEPLFNLKYIDDFNDGALPNLVGGRMTTEVEPPSQISFLYDRTTTPDNKGFSLKIKYELYPEKPAKLIINLNEIDISQAYGISFGIKYLKGPKLEIFLEDGKGKRAGISLEKYLIPQEKWQKITLMREDFQDIDFNCLKNLILTISTPGVEAGEFFLDDFSFFGPPGLFFESIKDNLYGFPEKKKIDKKYLWKKPEEVLLKTLASDSWLYFKNLINKDTHLPVDWIDLDETKEYRIGDYTSPTNIGLYFLSIVGAYDLNLIVREEAVKRAENTLNTLKKLPRWRGLYYNWYSTTNLQITRRYISTVDNGWLSAGLIVLRQVFPEVYSLCSEILEEMDYSTLYDPVEGKLYLGYELNRDPPVPTPYHYGQIATEPRVTSLIAIGKGDVSEDHWFRIFRTLPQSWTWQRQIPQGKYREYLEIDVFEGYYTYKDLKIVPSWGGSLFEFLMPVLVLKEKELAPRSLGLNNFNAIKAHIDYALNEKKYPVWGLSPCATPDGRYGGYHEYGLASLGAKGYPDEGIITPYASILAIDYFPEEVVKNIHELMKNFDLYGEYGMYDSVDVHTQKVASRYLCLDQAMIFVSLVNYLTNGKIREYFHQDQIIKNVESLLKMEEFF